MNKFICQLLATFAMCSLLTGCSVSEKVVAKFSKPSLPTSIAALDKKTAEKLENSKDLKNPVKVHLSYAKWKEETEDFSEAEKSYRLVLHKQPNNQEAKLGLARILMMKGQVADAGELFQTTLKNSPEDPKVLLQVSQYYAELNDWNQATRLLERAKQINPRDKDIIFHLGVALGNSGDVRGAYSQFRSVLSERDSHYNLANIHYKRGDMLSAERHCSRVLELDPTFQPAQEMVARLNPKAPTQNARYASHQQSRRERLTIPASAQRPSKATADPFEPIFEYSEERTPAPQF